MTERWMIYGATGHTGRLLAHESLAQGLSPLLAGRDGARLRQLAVPLRLEHRAARLDDPAALARLLKGVRLVLNAAGPFVATAGPLVAACLATGTHYMDVAGEPAVFAALQRLDGAARQRRIMLLPGAGFVIVATDCLAAHVARRLPDPIRLRIGISRPPFVGRGTWRTAVRYIGARGHIRRAGRLLALPGSSLEHGFDYGQGPRASLAVESADVITAYRSTGIPEIEVYLELLPWERTAFQSSRLVAGCLRSPIVQSFLKARIEALPEGPSLTAVRQVRYAVVAEVEDRTGRLARSRLRTPDGYTFTAAAALTLVRRVLDGDLSAGFQTPSRAYGADFVLGLKGVSREDLMG